MGLIFIDCIYLMDAIKISAPFSLFQPIWVSHSSRVNVDVFQSGVIAAKKLNKHNFLTC